MIRVSALSTQVGSITVERILDDELSLAIAPIATGTMLSGRITAEHLLSVNVSSIVDSRYAGHYSRSVLR